MLVVILTQSAATSRAYTARYTESFSENTDLVGLGLLGIKGMRLVITQVLDGVNQECRSALHQLFGKNACYDNLQDVIETYQQQVDFRGSVKVMF